MNYKASTESEIPTHPPTGRSQHTVPPRTRGPGPAPAPAGGDTPLTHQLGRQEHRSRFLNAAAAAGIPDLLENPISWS